MVAYVASTLEDRGSRSGRALRHALHVPLALRWSQSNRAPSLVSVEQGLFLAAMFSGMSFLVAFWTRVYLLRRTFTSSNVLILGLLTVLALACISAHLWLRVLRLAREAASKPQAALYTVGIALLLGIICFVGFMTLFGLARPGVMEALAYERLTQFTNHVNPLIPATLLGLLLHLFCAGNLVRLRTAAGFQAHAASSAANPNSSSSENDNHLPLGQLFRNVGIEAPLLKRAELGICGALAGPAGDRISFVLSLCVLFLFAAIFVYVMLYVMPLSTVEGHLIDLSFAVLIPSCWFALSASFVWGLIFRSRLGVLLGIVGKLPLAPAFSRLPASLMGPISAILTAGPGRVKDLAPWVRRYAEIVVRATAAKGASSFAPEPDAVRKQFVEETSDPDADTVVLASQTFRLLIDGGSHVVGWLRTQWPRLDPQQSPAWVAQAEDFVAALTVFVLRDALQSFRAYFALLSGGSLLLGLAIASYVFEPQSALMSIFFVLLLVFVIAGMLVYVSLDRDEILSRLGGRDDPGKRGFNVGFFRWAFTWALIPIVTAIFIRYPTIWVRISTWFGPIAGW